MNLPFRFSLNTSTNKYGYFFDTAAANAATTANQTLLSIQTVPASPDGLGTTLATRLAAAALTVSGLSTRSLYINGFSLMAWNADVTQNVKVDIGLYDTVNSLFIPFYECCATGVSSGGIQKTFGTAESGLYIPTGSAVSSNLKFACRALKQGATDGAVTVSGDLSLFLIQP